MKTMHIDMASNMSPIGFELGHYPHQNIFQSRICLWSENTQIDVILSSLIIINITVHFNVMSLFLIWLLFVIYVMTIIIASTIILVAYPYIWIPYRINSLLRPPMISSLAIDVQYIKSQCMSPTKLGYKVNTYSQWS